MPKLLMIPASTLTKRVPQKPAPSSPPTARLGDAAKGIEAFRWTGTDWVDSFIDAYQEIYPNLSYQRVILTVDDNSSMETAADTTEQVTGIMIRFRLHIPLAGAKIIEKTRRKTA